jgi:predicted enzyme related to lactoylglutathione lyase
MSEVTTSQPNGTPTWIDLGIPDLDRAMEFYGALFGWEFDVGPEEVGRYTMCLLRGKPVAALMANPDQGATEFWWNMSLATDDCDGTAKRIADAGGTVLQAPMDVMDQGRMAIAKDSVGAQFGLWEARAFIGAQLVNEPNTWLRNDLVTPTPEPARAFYSSVFDYTLDANPDLPGVDFTFLRRPDGHEIGGIIGDPAAGSSSWTTLFLVEDTDAMVERARAAGGQASEPTDMVYGRIAEITDPFGASFRIGAPPRSAQ